MYRIVIADDEKVIRSGIVQLVDWQALDCIVVCECSNGQEVLDYVQGHPADIVITDIKMPVMDGISLTHELQLKHPEIRTILLTVYNKFDFAQKALRYGASDYIIKNEFTTELPKTVTKIIKKIESEKSKTDRLGQNQGLAQEELKNMKGYLLERLMLSKPLPMHDGAEKYGLNQKKYCVCSCEITYYEKNQNDEDTARAIENFLNITVNRYEHYIVNVNKNNMTVVLCVKKAADLTVKDAAMVINEILRIVEEFMRIEIKFGISRVTEGAHLLNKAYKQSMEALSRIEDSGNHVLIYTDDNEKDNNQTPLSLYSDNVVRLFFTKQFDTAFTELNKMKHAAAESRIPLAVIKINIINMCSALFGKVEEYYLWENAQKTESEVYNNLNAGTTIYTMFGVCEKLLAALRKIIDGNKMEKHYIVHAIDEYIRENYCSNITLQGISEKIHVSPSYISRLYKKKTGMTITNSINMLRVEKSKILLRETRYKIYEIAEMAGIEDAGYFTNIFTKYAGCTPSQYRGNHIDENQ